MLCIDFGMKVFKNWVYLEGTKIPCNLLQIIYDKKRYSIKPLKDTNFEVLHTTLGFKCLLKKSHLLLNWLICFPKVKLNGKLKVQKSFIFKLKAVYLKLQFEMKRKKDIV